MNIPHNRRQMLQHSGLAVLGTALSPQWLFSASGREDASGAICGEPTAEAVGAEVLAQGGNAVDAIVAAAFTAAVVAPHQTGIGGYGGCLMLALGGTKKVTSIEFNSVAPRAMSADVFKPNPDGKVPGAINDFGWLAAGVPAIPAGLQFVLERYGTRPIRELLQPAIKFAREGVTLGAGSAFAIRAKTGVLAKDPGSRKLFLKDGQPLAEGARFCNPELAALLTTLAERNSVASFYQGDIARQIADAFARNGGLLTAEDLAAYSVRETTPLALDWQDFSIQTAPLTAGGLTTLQALNTMKALDGSRLPAGMPQTHACIESLRLAWRDRLALLGDPEKTAVPVARLLARDYAEQSAAKVHAAVKAGKILAGQAPPQPHTGTVNLSAADRHGNLVALTLTHGNAFGACVTVDGLGLTLGHGMSRFDPQPGHPNSPGPGKRPLHNMCPAVLLHQGQPVIAAGGRGGRKIINAMFEVLLQLVAKGAGLQSAIEAPRLHTEGGLALTLEKTWPAAEVEGCRHLGYTVARGTSAVISGVSFEAKTGHCRAAMR
jgi:gamma-glutamyltranspeptidase / glutathione hydrolase